MIEGIFKCGHASGSILSVVKEKLYTGFYFEKAEPSDSVRLRLVGTILQAER
jgi:hypothetical protein